MFINKFSTCNDVHINPYERIRWISQLCIFSRKLCLKTCNLIDLKVTNILLSKMVSLSPV